MTIIGCSAAVSADASVVVGGSVRWTESEGTVSLGSLGGPFGSNARAVSADGSGIVGDGSTETGAEAFYWTIETGRVGLG